MSPFITSPTGPSPYSPGYSPWMPAGTPAPTPMPSPDYQGLVDQLHLANQSPPQMPAPVATTIQPLSGLTGLLQRFVDFVHRLLSGPSAPSAPSAQPPHATEFTISSFNVLGSSHTKPGGEKPGMDSGPVRVRRVAQLLTQHKVDVVGFQELQGDQLREFLKVAGDKYGVYPGTSLGKQETVNSIAWRKDKWELVRPGSIEIPYFNGAKHKMPVILLRNRETGQEAYFANFHNPADTHRFHNQEKWRDKATTAEIELVNRLRRESGLPVFVTGDMNEREEYFQRMTGETSMVAANGSKGRPPKQMGIDWIFGSSDVTFSGFKRDRSALVKQTSDHPMILSKARIGGT